IFNECWKGIIGGDPTGAAFAAGMSLTNCAFIGTSSPSAPSTDTWIEITGASNSWWLKNIWIEGCDKGIVVGNGVYGPNGFCLDGAKVAAMTTCVNLVAVRRSNLTDIRFDADPSGTPTDLVVNSNSFDGFAANLISTLQFEIPTSVFPGGWTYFPRHAETTRLPARFLSIGDSYNTSTAKYLQVNGAKFGH